MLRKIFGIISNRNIAVVTGIAGWLIYGVISSNLKSLEDLLSLILLGLIYGVAISVIADVILIGFFKVPVRELGKLKRLR